jgi:hypothetical protein
VLLLVKSLVAGGLYFTYAKFDSYTFCKFKFLITYCILPLFPRYPQSSSSSASTSRSHAAPSSSSRPPYQAVFYPARPPAHPPLRMFPLGGPPLKGLAPIRAPAPGGPGPAPQGPAPAPVLAAAAPVPSSSLGPALQQDIEM